MLLFQKINEAVMYKQPMHYPSALEIKKDFLDFNKLFSEVVNNDFNSSCKHLPYKINNDDIFSQIFQINDVQKLPMFQELHDFIVKGLPDYTVDRLDLFTSFKKTMGVSHVDNENSLILSLYKNTIYRFQDKNLTITLKPGDILLSPAGVKHFAMSYEERIILSWGIHKR